MMTDLPSSETRASDAPTRWELIRDLAVFQIKLGIDAVRDVLLSPVSLVAGLVDLLVSSGRTPQYFYAVLVAGRRSEAWINLFGEAERVSPRNEHREAASLDSIVEGFERLIVEQYERGGVTASAKAAIDRSLDRITRTRDR